MQTSVISKDYLLDLYRKERETVSANDYPSLLMLRDKAILQFDELGFPSSSLEAWKHTSH